MVGINKNLSYYMALDYPIQVQKQDDDGDEYWVAEILDLPGCISDGSNPDEAIKSLDGAKQAWIETHLEDGYEVPEPTDVDSYSGRFLLRMPKSLHHRLSQEASRNNVSLNQYIVSLISSGGGSGEYIRELRMALQTMSAQIGSANVISTLAIRLLKALQTNTNILDEQNVGTSFYELDVDYLIRPAANTVFLTDPSTGWIGHGRAVSERLPHLWGNPPVNIPTSLEPEK